MTKYLTAIICLLIAFISAGPTYAQQPDRAWGEVNSTRRRRWPPLLGVALYFMFLQFRPRASDAARDAGNGNGRQRSCLEHR